jgi:hypothetical protein
MCGFFVPLFIFVFDEYEEVLKRPKFSFDSTLWINSSAIGAIVRLSSPHHATFMSRSMRQTTVFWNVRKLHEQNIW